MCRRLVPSIRRRGRSSSRKGACRRGASQREAFHLAAFPQEVSHREWRRPEVSGHNPARHNYPRQAIHRRFRQRPRRGRRASFPLPLPTRRRRHRAPRMPRPIGLAIVGKPTLVPPHRAHHHRPCRRLCPQCLRGRQPCFCCPQRRSRVRPRRQKAIRPSNFIRRNKRRNRQPRRSPWASPGSTGRAKTRRRVSVRSLRGSIGCKNRIIELSFSYMRRASKPMPTAIKSSGAA